MNFVIVIPIWMSTLAPSHCQISQQLSSPDFCLNIAHIRNKTFRFVIKHVKFVKVSFQVLIKWHTLLLNAFKIFQEVTETPCDRLSTFFNWCVLQLSTKQQYQRINHCILPINILHACFTFENYIMDALSPKIKSKAYWYLIVFLVTIIYASFLPISAEGKEDLFHRFRKVYKHCNDGSFT